MGDVQANLNKSAIKIGSTWDTEVDVNVAGSGIYLTNPGAPKPVVAMLEDESATVFEKNLDVGNLGPVDFSMEGDLRYDGIENVLEALFFGTAPAPTQQAATTAYLHAISLANSLAGKFATYATEKLSKIHIVPSFKVQKETLSLNNGLIKYSFGVRGSRVIDSSAIITAMTAVTYPANAHHRAKAAQAVFRINAQSGADFSSSDVIRPKNFTLEMDRSVDGEAVLGSQVIAEPLETAKPKIKLTLEFPRMDAGNAAYFADWVAGTEKKADVTITGPLIASTFYYYKKYQFPRMIIEDVEYADSKIIPAKVTLRAVEPDTAPTGMTGLILPVYSTLMNTRSTSLLA